MGFKYLKSLILINQRNVLYEIVFAIFVRKGSFDPVCSLKRNNTKNKFNNNYMETDFSLHNLESKADPILVVLIIEDINYTFHLGTSSSFTVSSESFYKNIFK